MRLQLALMDSHPDAKAIGNDIAEMEEMIDVYLAFAAGEGEEQPQETDVAGLLERLVEQAQKTHKFDISYVPPPSPASCISSSKKRDPACLFKYHFKRHSLFNKNHCVTADS